jgi:serine phosphatase RsbU (regulator of sigma subunit)
VLLYTDGLIERRTESLSEGMDRLLRVAATHREESAAELVGAVVRDLHDPAHVDDVCVLAARV